MLSGKNRTGSSLNLDTTVVGLQGLPISTTVPTTGQALVFDGTNWVPTTVQTGGGGAAVGPAPPSDPNEGDLWFNTGDNTLNVWNGSAWVPVDSSSAIVQINNVLPNNPATGELYWDLTTAKLFLWDGLQWVAVINTPEGIPGPAGPPGATGPAGPNVMPPGVIDGSNAAPGQVGEYVSGSVSSANIVGGTVITGTIVTVPPGDWDVYVRSSVAATVNFEQAATAGLGIAVTLFTVSVTNNYGIPLNMPTGNYTVTVPVAFSTRLNSATPTNFQMQATIGVGINAFVAATAGTFSATIEARRAR